MNYENLIRNWHAKASEEDYFSKFVFEYLAFIAYLKTKLYDNSKTDREAIQRFKRDDEIKNKYLDKIRSQNKLKEYWEKIKGELNDRPLGNVSTNLNHVEEIKWWNCSHLDINQKTSEEKAKPNGVIHSLEDWENMVEFWYSIRNNLFHGAKNPENKRDKFAVRYGYLTLKELMEIMLNERS